MMICVVGASTERFARTGFGIRDIETRGHVDESCRSCRGSILASRSGGGYRGMYGDGFRGLRIVTSVVWRRV